MSQTSWVLDFMAYFLVLLKVGLWTFGVVFLLNGLNDVFFDIVKLSRDLWRSVVIFGLRGAKPLSEEDLMSKPEQPVAIMVPCWDESAVIRRMLENSLAVLNYGNFVIFVGTYPNDPATQREVDLVRERFDNVERVVCPKDGPTSKADCLNWVYEGIGHYEKTQGVAFEIFLMEDSEDVLHPLTLKLCNFMVPRMDMVQLPVIPMESRWHELTRGTYLDELATYHSRDILVREILTGNLPSAGVGTALSRSLLKRLYEKNAHQLFTIGSVTEDYDFGIRLIEIEGVRQIFSRVAFERTRRRASWLTGRERLVTVRDFIGIREYFPNTLRAAIRQKSRWVVGITLQAWETIGWVGGFWMRYMLFRDRISLLTNQVSMLANILVPVYLMVWGYGYLFPNAYHFPPIVMPRTPLYYVLLANLGLLLWHLTVRAYYVANLYNLKQAALSPVRLVWANVINYFATMRALKLFMDYKLRGKPVAWDKTAHAYPSEEELIQFRRRLGDLLLDRRFLTVGQLDAALERQRETGQPLGAVLVDMGYIQDDALLQVLGMQLSLQTVEVDPYSQDLSTIAAIPEPLALAYQVYPLEVLETGELAACTDQLPDPNRLRELEGRIARKIQLRLTSRGELAFALRRGYARLHESQAQAQDRLGTELLAGGLITQGQLDETLRRQRRSYRSLGELIVSKGLMTQQALDASLPRGRGLYPPRPLGQLLVTSGKITQPQLDAILGEQRTLSKRLGDLLIELGVLSSEDLQTALLSLSLKVRQA